MTLGRILWISLLLLAAALSLPLLFLPGGEVKLPESPEQSEAPASDASVSAPAEPETGAADSLTLTVRGEAGTEEYALEAYLPHVLAGEMPAGFALEALKAQAVAARTYLLSCMAEEKAAHPTEDVCTDPACCTASLDEAALREKWGAAYTAWWSRICRAVRETEGMYLTWEGEPIRAVFHASAHGSTENSTDVWSGERLPYLVSVSSPETAEEVPDYVTLVTVSPEEFASAVSAQTPEAVLDGAPENWLGQVTYTEGGAVDSITVGGAALSGTRMRALFSLRSACFSLDWTGEAFCFTVTGNGHGVGMSQYGANVLAGQGLDFTEILDHYYPGTTLTKE